MKTEKLFFTCDVYFVGEDDEILLERYIDSTIVIQYTANRDFWIECDNENLAIARASKAIKARARRKAKKEGRVINDFIGFGCRVIE